MDVKITVFFRLGYIVYKPYRKDCDNFVYKAKQPTNTLHNLVEDHKLSTVDHLKNVEIMLNTIV